MRNSNNNGTKKPNFNGKKRGNNYARKDKDRLPDANTDKEVELGQGSDNDFNWYNAYPQLAQDAGKFSFFHPVGNDFNLRGSSEGKMDKPILDILEKQTAPGIMGLDYQVVMGKSTDFGSQINIAARNIYSFLRSQNSGRKNYEPADLMMYLLSMDSAYSFYAWMVRTYGIMSLYTPTNKYFPNSVCDVIGVDFKDIQGKFADYRGYINLFGAKLGKLCVPGQLSLTKRHQWMNSNIFVDSNTAKAQSYIFNPVDFFKWEEQADKGGTALVREPLHQVLGDEKLTLDDIITLGDTLVNALMSSEDVGTISGDILRAYGEASIYKIAELPPTYQCLPIFSPEVLMQIDNATLLKRLDHGSSAIVQNPDKQALLCTPCITVDPAIEPRVQLFTANRIVNAPVDNPDPSIVYVATRLTATCTKVTEIGADDTKRKVMDLDACGTEILTKISVATKSFGKFTKWDYDQSCTLMNHCDKEHAINPGRAMTDLYAFDHHPSMYFKIGKDTEPADIQYIRCQRLDNYTVLTATDLAKLHEVALLSELTMSESQWTKTK